MNWQAGRGKHLSAFQQQYHHHEAETLVAQQLALVTGDCFRLVVDTRKRLSKVSKAAKEAVQKHYRTPEALKGFIESYGTPVYVLPDGFFGEIQAKMTIACLGFQYGYIPKPTGAKALKRYQKLLSWLEGTCSRNHKALQAPAFSVSSADNELQGIFLLCASQFNVPYLTHQLHHWMACRSGAEGYCDKAQALYKSFWQEHHGQVTPALLKKMGTAELLTLRQAINRDMEALEFLRAMVDEVFAPANQAKSLRDKP